MRTIDLARRSTNGGPLTASDFDGNMDKIEADVGSVLFFDLLAPIGGAQVPNVNAPVAADFGPVHVPQRRELSFAVGDYVFSQPFHINHDMKPGGQAFFHVHWSTNGTSTATVKWEISIMRALGHNQANFGAPIVIELQQAAHGSAWRHMITEASAAQVITMVEPDELLLATVRRVTNGGVDNADAVFALTADLHYEMDRRGTPGKAPDFYA